MVGVVCGMPRRRRIGIVVVVRRSGAGCIRRRIGGPTSCVRVVASRRTCVALVFKSVKSI